MVYLRGIRQSLVKRRAIIVLVFGSLAVISPLIVQSSLGVILAVMFTNLSAIIGFFTTQWSKDFGGDFMDTVGVRDSIDAVLYDKDGNIKQRIKQ